MNSILLEKFCNKSDINTCISEIWWDDEIKLNIRYISEFSSTKKIREFIDSICKKYHISPRWRTRLVLIVDELNNNAIEYWSRLGDTNTFEIYLKKANSRLDVEISVADNGNGSNPKTASEMETIKKSFADIDYKEHASIRGRWLFLIISHLVDSLQFHDNKNGGLRVVIQKRLEV